ncbi:acyltransferase [Massilia aurea]|uniref:acyltransferase family protein n=1 Tax=Massilia aurea TaxID=373040 RepID=UPI003461C0FC
MLDRSVSNRITVLRPLLIVAMVFTHLRGVSVNMSDITPGFFNYFNAFILHGVGRGTVPTMSLIAGFLLFSADLDLQGVRLFKKKFATLVIPFFVFALIYFKLMWVFEILFGMARYTELINQLPIAWADLLLGVSTYPANGPLHFLRDLIVFVLLAPLLGCIIRTVPVLGLLSMAIIFGNNQDGDLVFRGSSFIVFYIGGMAAVYRWKIFGWDKYAKPLIALFFLICVGMMIFKVEDNTLLVLISPFIIWPAASLLTGSRVEFLATRYSKYSFFVFAAHMPFMELSWWAVMSHMQFVPYVVYWLVTPIATIAILVIIFDVAVRHVPKVFNVMIGARSNKPKHAERRILLRPALAPVYSEEERALVRLKISGLPPIS